MPGLWSRWQPFPQANRKLVTNHPVLWLPRRALWPGASGRRLSLQPLGRAVGPGHCRAGGYHPRVWRAGCLYREHGQPQAGRAGAEDTGVKLVALYSGSLGEPGSGAETYILLIRYDVGAIVERAQMSSCSVPALNLAGNRSESACPMDRCKGALTHAHGGRKPMPPILEVDNLTVSYNGTARPGRT